MLQRPTIGERILELVKANPLCTLEKLTQALPELHWYNVYLEVDRLSRSGRLGMIYVLSTIILRLP
jgi:hypothetical protein